MERADVGDAAHRHRSSPPDHPLLIIEFGIRLSGLLNEGGNMSTATVPEVREGYFPHWKLKTTGVIMPEERLPWGQTIVSGMQHGVAMAGEGSAVPHATP